MKKSFTDILKGYAGFREKYASGDNTVMQYLAHYGQQPQVMVVACCDSRVDPALLLQCDPGDLFVVRNVANIVPPYEKDEAHHGTSAALEFAVCYLNITDLVILGHSQCGGIHALHHSESLHQNDFITNWVSLIAHEHTQDESLDEYAKSALLQSYQHCLTFPWIQQRLEDNTLRIHLWFFDIQRGEIFACDRDTKQFTVLQPVDKDKQQ
jgi:carbonic anhydrase